jgi:ferrous iron transport protein B
MTDESARRDFIRNLCELAARRPDAHQLTVSDRLDIGCCTRFGAGSSFSHDVRGVLGDFFLRTNPDGLDRSRSGCGGRLGRIDDAGGDLRSLLVDGVIGGVGGVVIFLPQILLLFFFIGLLESSGYMARAAFLMDGVMAKAGLSGKAFLPLFSSYACAIPGVMATRTIDSAKERLVSPSSSRRG